MLAHRINVSLLSSCLCKRWRLPLAYVLTVLVVSLLIRDSHFSIVSI